MPSHASDPTASARRSLAWLALLVFCGFAAAPSAVAQDAFEEPAPLPGAVCPPIAEDYEICRDNPLSGNCADFVQAAHELGRLYRFTVARDGGGQAEKLKTTVWWGCGKATFAELKALLQRIDSPEAQSVLAEAPYDSLPAPKAAAKPPAPAPKPHFLPDCDAQPDDAAYAACQQQGLAAAEAHHQAFVERCAAKLAPLVRKQLEASEAAWQRDLAVECPAGDSGTPCLAAATRRRTESIASGHPECRGDG